MKSRQNNINTKSQDFISILDRMKKWETAHEANKSNYILYLQRLKKLRSLEEISALLLEMLSKNIFPDTFIINQLITKMSQLKKINFALEIHQMAVEKHMANAITCACAIDAIAKSPVPDANLALRLFNEAKVLGLANLITYNCTIDAIAKSPAPDASLALRLFNEAKELGIADAITYSSTIDAIAKSPAPDKNLETLAFSILEEATQRFHRLDMQHDKDINLHELPNGEIDFELKNTHDSEINFQLIYRQLFKVSHPTPHVQSTQHESNALRLNSLFPSGENSKLNSDAKIFVPSVPTIQTEIQALMN